MGERYVYNLKLDCVGMLTSLLVSQAKMFKGGKNIWSLQQVFVDITGTLAAPIRLENLQYLPYWTHDRYLFKRELEQICELDVLDSCKQVTQTTHNQLSY